MKLKSVGYLLLFILSAFIIYTLINTKDSILTTNLTPTSQTAAISGSGSGLVAHYTFDDGTATDSSGNGNTGTVSGATPTTGKIGGGMQFDGSNDYINLSNTPISSYPFTLSAWVKSNNGDISGTVFSISDNTSTLPYYRIGISADDYALAGARHNTSNESQSIGSTNLASGWHHIAGVFSSETDRSIYVNGLLEETNTDNRPFNSVNTASIGVLSRSSMSAFFKGSIDDVRVYNRTLSTSEIQEIYTSGGGVVNEDQQEDIGDISGPTISEVSVSNITSTSATISWTTDEPSDTQIFYDRTTAYGSQTGRLPTLTTSHTQTLTNLQPNSEYNYYVRSEDSSGNVTVSGNQTFRTLIEDLAVEASGTRTFYIDYESGNDSNSGTSKTSSWKRHPFMNGFSGSYTHQAGDRFIFKGGVSWPASAMTLYINEGGTVGKRDYYGVDKSWYKGNSWTRPIFDMQGVQINDARNTWWNVIWLAADHVDIDNIEIKGQLINKPLTDAHHQYNAIRVSSGLNEASIKNVYIHSWIKSDAMTQDCKCAGIVGGGSPSVVIDNTIVEGTMFTGGKTLGAGIKGTFTIKNSKVTGTTQGLWVGGSHVSYTTIGEGGDSFSPTSHENGAWLLNGGVFHNNIITGRKAGVIMYVVPGWSGNSNRTQFFYNNLIYGNTVGQVNFISDGNISGGNNKAIIYNNVYRGGFGFGLGGRNGYPMDFVFKNNLTINTRNDRLSPISIDVDDPYIRDLDMSNNVIMTLEEADSYGMTIENKLKPTMPVPQLTDKGVSTSIFNTDYLDNTRGAIWDIGAYEYGATRSSNNPSTPSVNTGDDGEDIDVSDEVIERAVSTPTPRVTAPVVETTPDTPISTPTTTTAPTRISLTRNLTLGSTGTDVRSLQQFLNAKGFTVSTTGGGSPGNETTYFGPATRSALARYQASKGITPAVGFLGPITIASINSETVSISTPTTTTIPTTTTASFTRNLTLGSRGLDVLALQKFLNSKGFTVSTTGAGSPGNETTYFGPATRSALARYQASRNITPSVGFFGPLTRARVVGE